MKNKMVLIAFATIIPFTTMAQPPESSNFVAQLSGDQEAPMRDTNARGQAFFQLTGEGEFLAYRLIVANIENVVAAHIHLSPPGSNGPVVAFLYGPAAADGGRIQGVIGEGLLSTGDLVGPLAGQELSVLLEALRTGGAYVNVHTNDGVAPSNTGPGDFPGGEVRGQLRTAGVN